MSAAALPDRLGGAPAGKRSLRLWLRLLTCATTIEQTISQRLRDEFGSTLPRFDMLSALDRAGDAGLTMGEVSRMLMVSNGNVTGIIDRLVEDGLVLRSMRDGDRRTSVVRLTEKGRLRFAELAEVHKQWVDEMLGGLGSEEAHAVTGLLGRAMKDGDS